MVNLYWATLIPVVHLPLAAGTKKEAPGKSGGLFGVGLVLGEDQLLRAHFCLVIGSPL